MRIRRTTRAGASPDNSVGSGHGRELSPAVLVNGGPQAISSGLGADLAPDVTAIPLAALRRASTEGEVGA